MRKNQITAEQLQELKNILINREIMSDFNAVRDAIKAVGLKAETQLATPEEKKVCLKIRAAAYNPNDLGMYGKLNEIEKRIERTNATGKPMVWDDYNARCHLRHDMIVRVNGKRYAIEHKSSRGDWAHVKSDNIEDALQEYAAFTGWICWDTEDFTIFMPISELMEKLNGYGKKGSKTFFESRLSYKATIGRYCLKMQAYSTSDKKVAFLQAVGASGYNYEKFITENILERR